MARKSGQLSTSIRDNQIEIFGDLERGATRTIVYTVRGTTSGTFTIPPVKAKRCTTIKSGLDTKVWSYRFVVSGMANVSKWVRRGNQFTGRLSIFVGSFYWKPLPSRLSENHSPVVLYKDGQVSYYISPDERWRTVHLENIDPAYLEALLTIEDKRF